MNKLASKIVAFLLLLTCSFVSFAQTATGSKEIHNYNDSFFTNMSGEIMLGSIVVTDFSGGKLVTKEKRLLEGISVNLHALQIYIALLVH